MPFGASIAGQICVFSRPRTRVLDVLDALDALVADPAIAE
jgi:hypothetical protein